MLCKGHEIKPIVFKGVVELLSDDDWLHSLKHFMSLSTGEFSVRWGRGGVSSASFFIKQ